MTAQEAIELINKIAFSVGNEIEEIKASKFITALKKAVDALEKQIPKKPSETNKARCIHCACVVKRDERFCKSCGQALLWESEE